MLTEIRTPTCKRPICKSNSRKAQGVNNQQMPASHRKHQVSQAEARIDAADIEGVQLAISGTCPSTAPDHGADIRSGACHRLSRLDSTSLMGRKVPMDPFVVGDDVGYRKNPPVPCFT
jgi:hypothetical protein